MKFEPLLARGELQPLHGLLKRCYRRSALARSNLTYGMTCYGGGYLKFHLNGAAATQSLSHANFRREEIRLGSRAKYHAGNRGIIIYPGSRRSKIVICQSSERGKTCCLYKSLSMSLAIRGWRIRGVMCATVSLILVGCLPS